jgi:hypothetical protein
MSIWIATFSNDLDDDAPLKELEVDADSQAQALELLEQREYDASWQHYSIVNIRKRRGGARLGAGRPKGIARAGNYGNGVKTKPVRVPEHIAGDLPELISNLEALKGLLDDWENMANSGKALTSPRYEQARKLLQEIRVLGF